MSNEQQKQQNSETINRLTIGDREFIHAFQQIDGVIQRGQPLFGMVWIGSALALLAGFALGLGQYINFLCQFIHLSYSSSCHT